MEWKEYLTYLAVMAGVTYLIRMLPLAAFRRKIKSRFVRSFLFYVPYAVLGAMTFPAIIYSAGSVPASCAGLVVALLLAWCEKSLLTVAVCASAAAFLAGLFV